MNLLYPLTAFILVVGLCPVLRRLARKWELVDNPGGRKQHEGTIPLIGGLLVFPVFIAVAVIFGVSGHYLWLFLGLMLLLITGALDDRFGLPAGIKFAIQFLAAFVIVLPGDALILNLGNLLGFGDMWLGWGGPIFSIIAAVLLINAINLMDGLDGLAGGTGFIIMGWLAFGAFLAGYGAVFTVLCILLAALGGFLVFNLRYPGHARASVFLGDAGSLALGLSIAWFAMKLAQAPHDAFKPVTVAWILALPIYDTCGQFARRVQEGRHPFDADVNHFHHHLIHVGYTVGQATAFIMLLGVVSGAIGVGGIALGVPEFIMAYIWTALLLIHIFMSMKPARYYRLLSALPGRQAK